MLKVSKKRHRWKDWIDDRRVCKVLENAAEGLAWAWNVDKKKSPETFPVNTWYQFVQIEEQLENKPIVRKGIKVPPPPPSSGLDATLVTFGVAAKQKETARRAFHRSATQAGFFEIAQDRLPSP